MSNEEAVAKALEKIADHLENIDKHLERLTGALVYDNGGTDYVGVSINHDPDVIGDDTFSPDGSQYSTEPG